MKKPLPIVAIVGQPNVGKSTLLNKIAGQALAVTSDIAGTTRDRQYADTAWNDAQFTLVDTAGLNLNAQDELENNIRKQIEIAAAEADIILFVVDGKQSRSSVDLQVLKKFRNSKRPVLLAVNKLDSSAHWQEKIGEFSSLGIKKIFPVSSINGRGLGDLLDAIVDAISDEQKSVSSSHDKNAELIENTEDQTIAVSLIGKPNVGKSSVFNNILKQERAVVSAVPGTTRTAVDSEITLNGQAFTFIDTAGLKKKEFRQQQPDIYAGFQTFKSIRRSDVCLFLIDAVEEITKQDQRVSSEIFAMQKGCIILANKIDLYSEKKPDPIKAEKSLGRKGRDRISSDSEEHEYQKLRDYISMHFPFLWMCPVFFVSAKTGEGLPEALEAIMPIYERRHKKIDDAVLKDFLAKKMKTSPPKLLRDQKPPKVFGLKQVDTNPPIFELSVNHPAAISQQFRKFLENSIIKELDFYGTPISLRLKGKDKA